MGLVGEKKAKGARVGREAHAFKNASDSFKPALISVFLSWLESRLMLNRQG